jgi:hypothetical protein
MLDSWVTCLIREAILLVVFYFQTRTPERTYKLLSGTSKQLVYQNIRFTLTSHLSVSFNGGNAFCLKACDPRGPRARELCNNIYDTQGCGFNAPSGARNNVFESCASDNQNPPGVGAAVPPASSLCSNFREHGYLWRKCNRYCSDSGSFHDDLQQYFTTQAK